MFSLNKKGKSKRSYEFYLNPLFLSIIAAASILVFIHFQMSTAFAERKQVQSCHTDSLVATEGLSEEINMAQYYEFWFKTCMRDKGYSI